jgi:prevent-host-death family protein
VLTSNDKGNIAEMAIALEATKLGIEVLKPVAEHGRYDLAFDLGHRIFRVQCKSARRDGDVIRVSLVSSWHTPGGYVRNRYGADEIDLVAAHCHERGTNYLFPFDLVAEGKSSIQLRLSPPKNCQRAAIHYAAEYELAGAVAQLGERCHGMAEVRGSSPLSSTSLSASDVVVGAHEFRNHSGYWMERAAAGDEILITRRGRRYARLGPPDPRLATTDSAQDEEPAAAPAGSRLGTARTSH